MHLLSEQPTTTKGNEMKQSTMQWLIDNGIDNAITTNPSTGDNTFMGSLAQKYLFSGLVIELEGRGKNKAFLYEYTSNGFVMRACQENKETLVKFMHYPRSDFLVTIVEE